jgi:hypothetical protein
LGCGECRDVIAYFRQGFAPFGVRLFGSSTALPALLSPRGGSDDCQLRPCSVHLRPRSVCLSPAVDSNCRKRSHTRTSPELPQCGRSKRVTAARRGVESCQRPTWGRACPFWPPLSTSSNCSITSASRISRPIVCATSLHRALIDRDRHSLSARTGRQLPRLREGCRFTVCVKDATDDGRRLLVRHTVDGALRDRHRLRDDPTHYGGGMAGTAGAATRYSPSTFKSATKEVTTDDGTWNEISS